MLKSNRDLFESFNIIDTTWRKWSREFLPPDDEVGLRKGRTRMYSAEEAFIVWVGGKLLTEKQMTYQESKEALSHLEQFMTEYHLFPIAESRTKMLYELELEKPGLWEFEISRTKKGAGYSAKGAVSPVGHFNAVKSPTKHFVTEKFCRVYLTQKPDAPIICTVSIDLLSWIEDFTKASGFELK